MYQSKITLKLLPVTGLNHVLLTNVGLPNGRVDWIGEVEAILERRRKVRPCPGTSFRVWREGDPALMRDIFSDEQGTTGEESLVGFSSPGPDESNDSR